ncbi:UbiA family prenyltransferase [Autumnicola psychrophila]|uniref:UbiA family prenyltransferase n=1 Tax=Autumnicola psychrophila TaxID=3075592 RepID=A0ABU3DMX8_9FLAO|nr:UbiA family prenyltransferase [Zunongwangia sp. F225]MDT0684884.1 UbiA family prenyltransferase [Zunongwangia sp. F225]
MIPKDIFAYFQERFPVINMALFAILFFTVNAVAVYFVSTGTTREIWWMLLGVVAVISFFFRLRVFDEIKDFDIDMKNHPQRVLQSGRVKKKHLILISFVGTIIEIIWSLVSGFPVLICWSIAVGYSLLMRYEFFVGDFLNRHLLLYAITHMLVMPLIILWVYSGFHPQLDLLFPFYILAGLSLFSGFSFEIARKIYAPEAEKSSIDSYSNSVGYNGSIILVLVVLLCGVLIQSYLLHKINSRTWTYFLISFIFLFALFLYLKNIFKPVEKSLRTAEKVVSLFMLASYVSIIIEVHSQNI